MFVRNSQCILNYWVKVQQKALEKCHLSSLTSPGIFLGVEFGNIEVGERRMEENEKRKKEKIQRKNRN